MKFTLNWLKDHLETECSLSEICDGLVRLGHEVEEVVDPAQSLSDFRIVEIKEAQPHPEADRLQLCVVDDKKPATSKQFAEIKLIQKMVNQKV